MMMEEPVLGLRNPPLHIFTPVTPMRADTRSRVVEVLRRGPKTLDQLVGELGLTRTAIRLQLAALERDR